MSFNLPDLPYDANALEPHIDARTMEIHHGKHHQAYVNNLNTALEGHAELRGKNAIELVADLEALPESIRTAVRNNGGGHVNHSLFWTVMGPNGGGKPGGALADDLNQAFGSFDAFQAEFAKAATTVFGSGWAWLCVGADGQLLVAKTPNQDNPISDGTGIPILGLDVWEHAYYLNYQNRRPDYIGAWWNAVDWHRVAEYHGAVKAGGSVQSIAEWAGSQWAHMGSILDNLTD